MPGVTYDEAATQVVARAVGTPLRIIANRPGTGLEAETPQRSRKRAKAHHLPAGGSRRVSRNLPERRVGVLWCAAPERETCRALRSVDEESGDTQRDRGDPARPARSHRGDASRLFRLDGREPDYLSPAIPRFFGEGDTAPVAREVLRQAEPHSEMPERPRGFTLGREEFLGLVLTPCTLPYALRPEPCGPAVIMGLGWRAPMSQPTGRNCLTSNCSTSDSPIFP